MGLSDIIKRIIDMLPSIMVGVGVVFIVAMFMLIMGGSFEKQAVDGNIPVSAQTITALSSTQAGLVNATTAVTAQATTAVNYLPLIIVMVIALGFLGFLGFNAFKGSKSNI